MGPCSTHQDNYLFFGIGNFVKMPSRQRLIAAVTASIALCGSLADARDVFAHYMLGSLDSSTNHAAQDVSNAQAMGLDAFALNVASPTASWATDAISQLFTQAESSGFKLFFSMDTSGGWQFSDWTSLLQQFTASSAYYKGPSGDPFISCFDNGNVFTSDQWAAFKSSMAMYLVPDIDASQDYYTDINSWLETWGSIVDGAFSWETAWPLPGDSPANVSISQDEAVMAGMHGASKTYMVPLSPLQYKHWPENNQHWYRIGESNLPQRMTEILALGSSGPDFAEYITWNDAGESHYIGNIWDESISGADWIYAYSNSTNWSHEAWKPLVSSFIGAFKAGGDASTMTPPSGSTGVGAMWYRTIFASASCSSDPLGKPSSWDSAQDALNWAVVLPSGAKGYTARVSSGGNVVQDGIVLNPGLNYDSTPGLITGAQMVEILDGSGTVALTANSAIDVAADETDGICNFNYQVAALQ